MEKTITLYHGSSEIIEKPVFGVGRKRNDYGQGFYCTESEDLAKEWACTSTDDGFANRYSADISELNILDLSGSEYNILNWMALLLDNRTFRLRTPVAGKAREYILNNFMLNYNAYDIIKGYRADDAYYDFADEFLNNGITLEQLSTVMRLGRLGEQIVIKSKHAFSRLRFEGYTAAGRETYYPRRKARADSALSEYEAMERDYTDGIFVSDLMREKVKRDDPRIPGNISE